MHSKRTHRPSDAFAGEIPSGQSFVPWLIWGLVGMVVLSVAGVFVSTVLKASRQPLPDYGEIPDFTLTNQTGRSFTKADLAGNIWIADIIFTRCPGPCLDMTRRMKAIQDALPPGSPVRLLSLTADPEFDTPAVLNQYAARAGAKASRWEFLTGTKQAIYGLATAGLKLAVEENIDRSPGEDPFIHSTRMVIIDGRGRLRAFSSEGGQSNQVKEMLAAARRLAKEG